MSSSTYGSRGMVGIAKSSYPQKPTIEEDPILPMDTEIEFQIMVPVLAKGIIKGLTDSVMRLNYDDPCVEDCAKDSSRVLTVLMERSEEQGTPGYIC